MNKEEFVVQLLSSYSGQDDITLDTDFLTLNLDSLDQLEMSLAIEEKYGVDISEQAMAQVRTPRNIVDLINNLM